MQPKKIIIIGDAGRGKSTLAAKIANKLTLPVYSTDDFIYEVKFSKPRDRAKALEMVTHIYHQEKWIVEGTTESLLRHGFALADLILYLRHPSLMSQWRILFKRYLARKEETFLQLLGLMRHVFYKRYSLGFKKGKLNQEQALVPYAEKVIKLSSFKEIDEFIEKL